MDNESAAGAKDAAKAPGPIEAKAETPQPKVNPAAAAVDALVETWLGGLRNSDLAQHTPAWNALQASLPDLKAAILKHGG